jgi:Mor family transcriptional regulator
VFDHVPGFEITTKHKEVIRELHGFGEKSTTELIERYKLGKTTIYRVLGIKYSPTIVAKIKVRVLEE